MGQEYRMQKGALAIFQPGTEYVIRPHSPLALAVFDFDYTQSYHDTSDYLVPCAPDLFRPEQEHEHVCFGDAPALNQPFYHPNVTFLETEISEIISEFQVKKIFFREKNSTQFKNLLINLIRHQQLGNIHNDVVRQVVEYAITEIPAPKLSLGLANYGYDWPLPYIREHTVARTIGSMEAVSIARREGAEILFDPTAQSPWFRYRRERL
jgi:hypothetical protein